MGHSLCQCYLHLVFSTKEREPFLKDVDVRKQVWQELSRVCRNLKSPALKVNGYEDHAHILCRIRKTHSVSILLQEIKRQSSIIIKTLDESLHEFKWQTGYGAFSVGRLELDGVIHYIENQEEHHRKESFKDEFRRLCREYGITLDETTAWD